LLQSRKLQNYQEFTEVLAANGVAVEGSGFLAGIRTATVSSRSWHDYSEIYEALFTPAMDGQSRLYKLTHSVHLANGQELLQSSFDASALEKYGKTSTTIGSGTILEWRTSGAAAGGDTCSGIALEAMNFQPGMTHPENWKTDHIPIGVGLFRDAAGGSWERNRSCGDTLIISINIQQGAPYPPPDRALIDKYTAILYSPSLGDKGLELAQSVVDAAANNAARAAADKAKEKKPAL
jgi:hypothetical protein